ncbi:MAG: FAD:protein FMN transferase [Gemmatimonadetes bacterium]|nr:FAD:protein FMN transferase [Gemmatimonadota bacterium]
MIISLLLIPGLALLPVDRPNPVRIERHLSVMGTTLVISVEAGDRRAALAASEKALEALHRAEQRLSTWTNDTELARLNEAEVGRPVSLSPELAADLTAARRWWIATGGAFDPGIGTLSEIWGLRSGGKMPTRALVDRTADLPGLEALEMDGPSAARRHPDLRIDEGGFGKGAGLDDAVRKLKETDATSAMINLGGQVALFGTGKSVRFEVADPTDRQRVALTLIIDRGALATSGNSERGLVIGDRTYSHILDPKSGMPVPDFGSLTVWADDALAADCLSTGLYVLGPERALEWAAEHAGIEVLVLESTDDGLNARATMGFRDRIETGGSGVVVSFR